MSDLRGQPDLGRLGNRRPEPPKARGIRTRRSPHRHVAILVIADVEVVEVAIAQRSFRSDAYPLSRRI
jgi:hypothetical protein